MLPRPPGSPIAWARHSQPLHGYAFEITECAAARVVAEAKLAAGFELVTVCKKDSLEMTDEDRAELARVVAAAAQRKVLVTHGTSTMVHSARAVAAACTDKAVVITGALLPEKFKGSDAAFNVGCAVGALQLIQAGVYVAMSGAVYPHDQVARDAEGRFVPLDAPGATAGDDPGIMLPGGGS